MTRRQHPEEALQRTVAAYLDLALPYGCWWTTIPAGGGGKVRGAHLKAMGYKPGTPDILVILRGQALWLELKSKTGRLTKSQKQCRQDLVAADCGWVLVRSVEDVERALIANDVRIRASTGTRAA